MIMKEDQNQRYDKKQMMELGKIAQSIGLSKQLQEQYEAPCMLLSAEFESRFIG